MTGTDAERAKLLEKDIYILSDAFNRTVKKLCASRGLKGSYWIHLKTVVNVTISEANIRFPSIIKDIDSNYDEKF